MNKRKPIVASEGMILTNGEIYGTKIYLANGVDVNSFYEITIEEYHRILEEIELNERGINPMITHIF
jgi:hypothetical protein